MICRSVLFLPFPQIDVLPEVVQAVGGRVEVFMDGGVREGTDVLKALAMGAKAVFVGRPVLWGLVYNVSEHVVIMISIIRHGLQLSHAGNPRSFYLATKAVQQACL